MGKNKQIAVNLVASFTVLFTNILIGFFLSPYIVEHLGVEAYGFVSLASNFTGYAQLIVTALNSMAGRFITIAYNKGDKKLANIYYNSVFWGNLIIVAVLIVPAINCIMKLESFINISPELVFDVKLVFAFIFFNFFLTTGAPNWNAGVYVKNRLELLYLPNMGTAIFRCLFLVTVFTLFTPHVYYVSIASMLVTVISLGFACYFNHKLAPELRVKKGFHSWKSMWELVSSGIWNSINSVGGILLSGLDLLICNLFIGNYEMGVLSLSKYLPGYIGNFCAQIQGSFISELYINYAKEDKVKMVKDIKKEMKISLVIVSIPLAGIVAVGDSFYRLWVPSQDAKLLQILSVLGCIGYFFSASTNILINVFTTVNKVKTNSIITIISGFCSTALVFILLKTTNLGIYAVAGVSSVAGILKNLCYNIPFSAKYLGLKWNAFYPEAILSVIVCSAIVASGLFIQSVFYIDTWLEFVIVAACIAAIGILINVFLVMNKDERAYFKALIQRKLHR